MVFALWIIMLSFAVVDLILNAFVYTKGFVAQLSRGLRTALDLIIICVFIATYILPSTGIQLPTA